MCYYYPTPLKDTTAFFHGAICLFPHVKSTVVGKIAKPAFEKVI